ncbi:putative oocyte-secreted protein 1 homolog [Tenrec ecaudatus]|uniref:putative oocyte-secreted protein 1 homolog n=1 Tax=Tenrec ecaudatus TaxID=94439 RepID=UPI003F5943DC
MKIFLGLRWLFLLLSLRWTCDGDWTALQMQCTKFWLYVRIKPTLFYKIYMLQNEVFLGDDCPVTTYKPSGYYEFFYHPSKCNIKSMALGRTLLLKTKIKYISTTSEQKVEMPVTCVSRNYNRLVPDSEEYYLNSLTNEHVPSIGSSGATAVAFAAGSQCNLTGGLPSSSNVGSLC